MSQPNGHLLLLAVLLLMPGCSSANKTPVDPAVGSSSAAASTVATATASAIAAPSVSADKESATTMFVKEALADCEGEAPMKCMQVRKSEEEPWIYFYDSIEGFHYQESYAYELRVTIEGVSDPPADGSSLRYRLVEVVSKRKVDDKAP